MKLTPSIVLATIVTACGAGGHGSDIVTLPDSDGNADPVSGGDVVAAPDAGDDAPLGHECAVPTLLAATPWPEAEARFSSDPLWIGGDAAYSVALGGERVLWLFGDSFIATSPRRVRTESVMVRNSVAIQEGLDLSAASVSFHWDRSGGATSPRSFFPEDGDRWFWPGGGAMLEDRLVLFLSRLRPVSGGLGFDAERWDARLVENPSDSPDQWRVRPAQVPDAPRRLFPGGGGAFVQGDHLVAIAFEEPSHDVFAARWPVARARGGDLSGIEWWCGGGEDATSGGGTWSPDCEPAVLAAGVSTELSVHKDPLSGCFAMTSTQGFGDAEVVLRWATAWTGPWSPPAVAYIPPENDWPDAMVYAGKAHPELLAPGGELVVTYAVNSFDLGTLINDLDYYFPRFVRLSFRAQ